MLYILNVVAFIFIGIMATKQPGSTFIHFFKGFLFVQGIPLLTFVALIFYKNKSQEA